MKKEYPKHYKILSEKGHFPYEWFDDVKKLEYRGLPYISSFYSDLAKEVKAQEAYAHALKVYDETCCESFEHYLLLYLKCDVLLLADVFEKFRKMCLSYYKLDPMNYISCLLYTSPSPRD